MPQRHRPHPEPSEVLQSTVVAEREAYPVVTHEPVAVCAGKAGKASARSPMADD